MEPRCICGSGLVDAVAAGLRSGAILPSGRTSDGTKLFPVAGPVVLYQADIRELKSIHLAGAFGNYVQIDSAIRIGLIEAPRELVHAAGNTALRGAKMLLLAAEEPSLPAIEHISPASVPGFQDEFANCMTFPGHNA